MTQNEHVWFLKQSPLFGDLTAISQASIGANARVLSFPAQADVAHLLQSSGSVFVVMEGRIELANYLDDGRKAILTWLTGNDVWGALSDDATPGGAQQRIAARTIEPTSLMVFTHAYFVGLMERRPKVSISVVRMMGLRQRRYEVRLMNLLFRNNRQKLASLLLELSGYDEADPGKLKPPGPLIDLSHDELASTIGISREQVTRILGDFALQEMVESSRRKLRVLDIARLAKEAGLG